MEERAFRALVEQPLDGWHRALPPTSEPLTLDALGARGWNALGGDLPLPVMVLREAALAHNIALLADFCREHGLDLAPHAKTAMAPQLVRRQLEAGAWGITVATVAQARVFRGLGVRRILIANQVVDPASLRWIARTLADDPGVELYCLIDSPEGVRRTAALLEEHGASRPLPVLLELGVAGRRTGCRDDAAVEAVAAAAAAAPALALVGVEGYEGVIDAGSQDATTAAVDRFLLRMRATAERLIDRGALAARDEIIVSAGGSIHPDRVARHLGGDWRPARSVRRVLRSGCYVTHDHGLYERGSPFGAQAGDGPRLRAALELWATVLSRPEPDLAIVGFGRRDASYDVELPIPLEVHDSAGDARDVRGAFAVMELNDQHAFVRVPPDDALAVGDLLGCGISHPCTALERWTVIPVVDDAYDVIGGVRTFF